MSTVALQLLTALSEVVAPVIGQLFRPPELQSVELSQAEGGQRLQLVVHAGEPEQPDVGRFWVETLLSLEMRDLRRVLADEVETFIAESSFGWGERRVYTEGGGTSDRSSWCP